MASVFINDITSVVLVESSKSSNMPYVVYFPDVSTNGRLITVKDVDGFVSSGNEIYLSSFDTGEFFEIDNPIVINQPYGFITLATTGEGYYDLVNSYALPQGQLNYISNIYTRTTTVISNVEFIDVVTENSNYMYTSSGQLFFNGSELGDVTLVELQSTVANLGSIGYISSLLTEIPRYPSIWVATGITSNQIQAINNVSTPIGSIQYSYDGSNWSNAVGGFYQYGITATYGNGLVIATGANCSSVTLTDENTGFIQYSSNGDMWYNSMGLTLGHSTLRTALSYGCNIYHAVGYSPYGGSSTILYSENGMLWNTSVSTFNIPFASSNLTSGYATGVAYGNGVWVCSGWQNMGDSNYSLIYSQDGSNWNPAITVPFTGLGVNDVSFDGIKFMAICEGAAGASSNLVYSYDGKNWSNDNIIGASFANAGKYITGYSGTWVAYVSTTTDYIFYSSNQGSNWYKSTGLPANSVAGKPFFDGSKWLIGLSIPSLAQSIYETTSLVTWTNSGINSGFVNGAAVNSFSRTEGFSNATGYFLDYVDSIYGDLNSSNINTNNINVITANIGVLNTSSLFTNVTTVTFNNQIIENISTVRVDLYSTITYSNAIANISSLTSKNIEKIISLNVDEIISGSDSYENINANNIILENLELNSSRVLLGTGNRNMGVFDNYIGIGRNAALSNQKDAAIAIGFGAGSNNQAASAVAIGYLAGSDNQSTIAIAIGAFAGQNNSLDRTIILNASGQTLDATQNDAFYVRPIRNTTTIELGDTGLAYNISTKEVLAGFIPIIGISSFSTIYASSFSVNFPNPDSVLSVLGIGRITRGSNIIQFGGNQASNGPTITYNSIGGLSSAEFISAKDSSSTGGGFDFYTNVADNSIPTGNNFAFTIQQSTVGVNMSTPSFSLDVLGLLRATKSISTVEFFTSTIGGIEYPKTAITVSSLNVRDTTTVSTINIYDVEVNNLIVDGLTVFGTGCNLQNPNNPDLQTSNLNFYTSDQTSVNINKNYIQTTISSIIFNSTLSVNRDNNRVGINMSTPLHSLDVRGNIFVTSNIFAPYAVLGNGTVVTSDSNIKENIEFANLSTCYENTKRLPLRHFSYKSPYNNNLIDRSLLGFIAQEVQPIFPKSVQTIYNYDTQTELLHLSKDQILMSHYGATQQLIKQIENNSTIIGELFSKASTLYGQISTVVGGNV
jgi:hypothetical protein